MLGSLSLLVVGSQASVDETHGNQSFVKVLSDPQVAFRLHVKYPHDQ